jgi:hypothetical protein
MRRMLQINVWVDADEETEETLINDTVACKVQEGGIAKLMELNPCITSIEDVTD